jgi:hypothetical protein
MYKLKVGQKLLLIFLSFQISLTARTISWTPNHKIEDRDRKYIMAAWKFNSLHILWTHHHIRQLVHFNTLNMQDLSKTMRFGETRSSPGPLNLKMNTIHHMKSTEVIPAGR